LRRVTIADDFPNAARIPIGSRGVLRTAKSLSTFRANAKITDDEKIVSFLVVNA
jgi:hypothetical protein